MSKHRSLHKLKLKKEKSDEVIMGAHKNMIFLKLLILIDLKFLLNAKQVFFSYILVSILPFKSIDELGTN